MVAVNPRYSKQPGGGGAVYPEGGDPGDVLTWVGPGASDVMWAADTSAFATIGCVFDGASYVLEVGRFVDVPVPYNCTIVENELLCAPSGGLTIDIWKSTYGTFPPVIAGSIVGAAPISVSSGVKSKDSTLTGWSTTLAAGDILRFIITGASVITKATAFLKVLK